MSIAGTLSPASLSDSMVNNWAFENLQNIQSGVYPGLDDFRRMFSALLTQPFSRSPGGGVNNMQHQRNMMLRQQGPARGQIAAQGGDAGNAFANILEQGTNQLSDINNMILALRNQQMSNPGILGINSGLNMLGIT